MADASSPTGVDGFIDATPDDRRATLGDADRMAVSVVAQDVRDDREPAVDTERWSALARAAAESLGAVGEVTLTFVDADDMTELNVTHMGGDGPTDVLSFPIDDHVDGETSEVGGPPRLIGDIVICPSIAAAAATTHAGTVDDELALLVVHGVLHLLGYDHAEPDDTASMQAQEMTILTTYHWRGPAPVNFRHDHATPAGDGS